MPPVRSRRAAAFSWPVPTTGVRHERRVPALGAIHSGVQPGRILPVWNPGRKGRREGRKGGQDKGNRHYRSEEHTSELQSLMRISYAVFCLKKKKILNQ